MLVPCATLLSNGIYTGVLSSIGTMTNGIYKTIKSIYNYQNPDITKHIKSLDLEYKLKLIGSILHNQTLIPTLNSKEHINNKSIIFTTVQNSTSNLSTASSPIEISLVYLSNSIKEVHYNLVQINQKVLYHQTKWFNSWRSLNIINLLSDLETNTSVLQSRFDTFVKMYHIYDKANHIDYLKKIEK